MKLKNVTGDFSIIHMNCRSLHKNVNNVIQLLQHTEFSFDLIAITETWLSDKDDVGMFTLPGYSLEFTNRNFVRGGGVYIYSKSILNVCKIQELSFF